jgi:MFS family permease
MMAPGGPKFGRIAFSNRPFSAYIFGRFLITAALEMQSVAVGWQIYDITHRALDLGLVGLAQFLPSILLFLISGHMADRLDRRKLLLACYAGFAACSALLLGATIAYPHSIGPIYAVVVLLGVVRSFNGTAGRAILPELVPAEHFENAVAWNASTFQAATILGPSIGGVAYALFRGPAGVYGMALVTGIVAFLALLRVEVRSKARASEEVTISSVLAGIRFIARRKVILGSLSLDMFAVLFGGAVALLPVYARDILRTGPWGLGLLRSAPGVGAVVTATLMAYRPLRRRAGATMLWCVAAFAIFTVVFGLSRSLTLSLAALFMVGATDMVSVVVRGTLVQLGTPDEMRGRVNAVDMIFIGTSNELGQFESGLTAAWFGTVPAVVLGGIAALAVTGLWAWGFPELRRAHYTNVVPDSGLQ